MVLLQPKLHLKVTQKQILTPGLVQMVSVLALNKLELRDMITAEMVENPVLEELEASVPLLDEVSQKEEERDRVAAEEPTPAGEQKEKDPFDEIDFGAYFQEYLDPGYRSHQEREDTEKPSFENFISRPQTLTDHLAWQLSSMKVRPEVAEAAELIIGNLNEDGYLIATDDELMGVAAPAAPEADAAVQENLLKEVEALGLGAAIDGEVDESPNDFAPEWESPANAVTEGSGVSTAAAVALAHEAPVEALPSPAAPVPVSRAVYTPTFTLNELHEALELVRQLDP